MSGCQDWACTHPTPDNAGLRTLHTMRHIEFSEWLAARAPFTEPSPRALVEMTAGEMHVTGACPRREHASLPRHPQHAT